MDLKFSLNRNASSRNVALIMLLLIAVGALYYQNVLSFSSYYTLQEREFEPSAGPPLLSAGEGQEVQPTPAAAAEDAGASGARSIVPLAAPASVESAKASQPLATETFQEKGPLQDPALYYAAIGFLALMLFLNIFKVSFQSSAIFDSDIFKTLSSETRVEMLYALQERRKTLSELAAQANISLPGAKQHLSLLETKGLVRKLDEGRKWKYYELTDTGRSIIAERYA